MPAQKRDDDDLPLPPPLHGTLDEAPHEELHDEGSADIEHEVAQVPEDFPAHALDDSEARDLDVGAELDHVLPDHLSPDEEDGATASAGVDIGDSVVDLATDSLSDEGHLDDSTGIDGDADHDGIDHDGFDAGEDDGGAEGTSERIEDEVDPDQLPELDADDDGDVTDEELLEAFVPDASDTSLPPWSDAPWTSHAGCGARVACRQVAVYDARVVAVGQVLLLVDPEARAARSTELDSEVFSLALLNRDAIVASGSSGVLLLDPEPNATPTTIWQPQHRVELTFAASRIWGHTEGALWRVALPPGAPTLVRDHGVIGMASADGTLIVLARDRDADEPCIERLRSDDEGWQRQRLSGEALRLVSEHTDSGDVQICATAGGVALALVAGGELLVSRDGGADFHRCALPPTITASFAGTEADAPLVALVEDGADAVLVGISADSPTVRLAEVGRLGSPDDDDGAPARMVWDASRELLWMACRSGLLAFGPSEEP